MRHSAIAGAASLSPCSTPDNVSMFLDNIPPAQLPRVFQDAIFLVRQLGLQYIWIDALCIIQDPVDKTDWAREAGRMRSVYGGSTLNIAATSATSVHGSCFDKPKYHRTGLLARVTVLDAHGSARCSMVRNFYDQRAHRTSVNQCHLASRGWALQERLLPCRTLYVGNRGFFWECCAAKTSDFFTEGAPPDWNHRHWKGPRNEPWDWDSVAEHYSATTLTFSSDRLPALSGIAQRQAEFTRDDYIAGMWRSSLVADLPWMVEQMWSRTKRPEWRAPSWSWLSVDGRIFWGYPTKGEGHEHTTQFVRVLEVAAQPAGPDPRGALKDGHLTLACATMIPGRLQSRPEGIPYLLYTMLFEPSGDRVPVLLDCLEEPREQVDLVFLLPLQTSQHKDGRTDLNGPKCSAQCTDEEKNGILETNGLVLQRCRDAMAHFRRVGAFRVLHYPRAKPDEAGRQLCTFHVLKSIMESVGTTTAAAECMEVKDLGKGDVYGAQYVIKIV